MAIRAILAITLAIAILFGGFVALGYQSQAVGDSPALGDNSTNATQDAYNMTNDIYEGYGQVLSPGLIWMGVGVIGLLALGFLVYVAGGGR